MILQPEILDPIDLETFVDYLRAHLDPESEESILAAAPYLSALGRNRTFLAEYIARSIAAHDFQRENEYTSPVILLARIPHCLVRVAAWPPADAVDVAPSGQRLHVYEDEHAVAHSHAFSLLTVGYFGPGYETDVYACDPDAIRAGGGRPGQSVDVQFKGRYQLSEGTVMYYPAHRVAHVQHPPASYSISLNLIVKSEADERLDQYFFDLGRRVIAGSLSACNDTWRYLIGLAGELRDVRLAPALDAIASSHGSARVRDHAVEARAALHV